MGREEEAKDVVYHGDTTSLGFHQERFSICFSWEEPLEQPSNEKVNPHVVYLEPPGEACT